MRKSKKTYYIIEWSNAHYCQKNNRLGFFTMSGIKNYLWAVLSLIVMLVVAKFLLKNAGKLPVIGGVAKKTEQLID